MVTLSTEGLTGDKGRLVALDEGVDGAHEGGVGCVTIEVDEGVDSRNKVAVGGVGSAAFELDEANRTVALDVYPVLISLSIGVILTLQIVDERRNTSLHEWGGADLAEALNEGIEALSWLAAMTAGEVVPEVSTASSNARYAAR